MRHVVQSDGSLLILADNADRSELADRYRSGGCMAAEFAVAELLHERLTFIPPENIGALTSAPIFANEVNWSECDNGGITPVPYPESLVWWYPNYAVSDPWEELRNHGRVVFTAAPKES